MNAIFLGLIAILVQGFFSGSETAYSRANWIRLAAWHKHHSPMLKSRASNALRLVQDKERVVVLTLIFTNLSVVAASTIFTRFFIVNFGPAYTSVAVLVVLLLSLIIGDFIPKIIAQAFPEYWAIIASPVIRFLKTIFLLILPKTNTEHYNKLSRTDFLYLLKQKPGKESIVVNQIAKALFDFSQITIAEIMIPKERIVGLSEDASIQEIRKTVEKYRFSRYPIYKKNTGEITAIVHIKDMLQTLNTRKVKLSDIFRKPFIVKTDDKATAILKTMTRQGEHLAIVTNTQAQPVGIITMEDLIEEVVGEIRSET